MLNNIQFHSQHINSKHNVIPDMLSRSQIPQALEIAPWLDRHPHQVPKEWLPW